MVANALFPLAMAIALTAVLVTIVIGIFWIAGRMWKIILYLLQ